MNSKYNRMSHSGLHYVVKDFAFLADALYLASHHEEVAHMSRKHSSS
jgi:hypothetical protein